MAHEARRAGQRVFGRSLVGHRSGKPWLFKSRSRMAQVRHKRNPLPAGPRRSIRMFPRAHLYRNLFLNLFISFLDLMHECLEYSVPQCLWSSRRSVQQHWGRRSIVLVALIMSRALRLMLPQVTPTMPESNPALPQSCSTCACDHVCVHHIRMRVCPYLRACA